jgi:Pyruvate/2-oxoacid:ferredoxin oxidoreductase gamma subunit
LVLVNNATFTTVIAAACEIHRVDATGIATELGHPLGASMVMAGAYAGLTGIVGAEALVEAMRASIPSYRTQHIAANEGAIRAGIDAVETGAFPAWTSAKSPVAP